MSDYEPERRAHQLTEDRVSLMIEESMSESLAKHEQRMMMHIDGRFAQLHSTITSAFPNGDPHGHRMAHEKEIRDADGWRVLKADVFSKFVTAGLWAAFVWMLVAMWRAFKDSLLK